MPGPSDTWQSYGLSWANASNSPFRRFKKWLEEGGVATPFIASWPAAIKPDGLDTRSVLHVMDFMPTLAELAGAEYPRQFGDRTIRRVQGESFADLLVNPAAGRRKREKPLFWEHLGHRAARFGPWKVVDDQPAGDGWSLFDLRVDRTETHDVADDHPNIVGRLSRQWDRWKDRVGVRTYDESNGYGTPEDESTMEDESALEDRAEASAS
jgi:arylsulfatase